MIKRYRNVLLAAAVAAFAAGCGGGDSDENPLGDPDLGTNLSGGDDATLQAIADLIGGLMGELVGVSTDIFDTFNVVSSPETSMGRVLNAGQSSVATPIGVNTTVNAKCTGGVIEGQDRNDRSDEFFELAVLVELVKDDDPQQLKEIPDFEQGFKEFALGDLETAVDMRFTTCNEPTRTYDDDPANAVAGNPLTDPRVMDGNFSIVLSSTNKRAGADANEKDFELEGFIEMKDFYIQTDLAQTPDLITGDVTMTLITDDVDTGIYDAVLGFSVTANDGVEGTWTRTMINASGDLTLNDDFGITDYQLNLGGDLSSSTTGNNKYRVVTGQTIVKSDGDPDSINPESGSFLITDIGNNYEHLAVVENGGITFTLQVNDAGETEETFCTWGQINEENDQECNVNNQY